MVGAELSVHYVGGPHQDTSNVVLKTESLNLRAFQKSCQVVEAVKVAA
jgi:hypothetical protein